jgi:FlaA1/EpsC-like NDP-sugar epimerase
VQLVLQAGTLGQGGEVFTLDMGEQIKIADLARDIIQLSGLKVGDDIDIVYSGLRPGEKLYEELFMPDETFQRTQHKKIFIAANASTFVPQELPQRVEMLIAASEHNDVMFVLDMLEQLIPQHQLEQVRQLHKVREVGAAPASAGEPSAPWALQSGEKLMARVVGA